MPDAAWAAVAAIAVALITAVIAPLVVGRNVRTTASRVEAMEGQVREMRRMTTEMHRMTTVNHHSTQPPTILDKLDDIATGQLRTDARMQRVEEAIGLPPLDDA